MNSSKNVSWLHISDLHAGQDGSDWLWPNLKSRFYADLEKTIPAMGGLDLVIFSGDLTQTGSFEDFSVLRKVLDGLWSEFAKLNARPQLFLVPGNHDLKRLDKYDPIGNSLKTWWENVDIRESFWKSNDSPYRNSVVSMFGEYTKFCQSLRQDGFPILPATEGLLPGDLSSVFEKNGVRVGLVGLNSSYLHFFDTPERSTLDLHPRQLLAVTEGEPTEWCSRNYVNFLVTHHPQNWLHPRASALFDSEINPAGRFTAHFFGHMHEPRTSAVSYSGALDRRAVQAASLLGLRRINGDEFERVHGYSGGSVSATDYAGELKFWPRIDGPILGGARQFMADGRFGLTEANNFVIGLRTGLGGASLKSEVIEPERLEFEAPAEEARAASLSEKMGSISYRLKKSAPHSHVRKPEQHKLRRALETGRRAWLSADWNSGVEEFISSVISSDSSAPAIAYRFVIQDYSGRDDFFSKFSAEAGTSFQEFAKIIFDSKGALLLLDDVPVSRGGDSENWEKEIVSIVDAFQDYCPNSLVILVSRQRPLSRELPQIEVLPLDEADVRTYLINSPAGGAKYAGASAVSDIFQITEGFPIEIDGLLKELKFISLQDYLEIQLTAPRSEVTQQTEHDGAFSSVDALRLSTDSHTVRAYGLLCALSVFPYGETLKRIRRFNNQQPFHSEYALVLEECGVVEVLPVVPTLGKMDSNLDLSPRLHVRKPIREYILSKLTADEVYDLYKSAAAVYFGEDWLQGSPKNLKTNDVIVALGGGGLGNPNAIINNLFQRASESSDAFRFRKIVVLARLFVSDLEHNDNFRSTASACRDFLRLLSTATEDYSKDRDWMRVKLGLSLRMLGDPEGAISSFSQLNIDELDKPSKLRVLLNWAMAEEKNENFEEAKRLANQVIALGKATFPAMEAESMLLQLSPEDSERIAKLKVLEKRARGRKANSVANNIVYFLSRNGNWTPEEKRATFRKMAKDARQLGDPYDASRAIAEIGLLARDNLIELKSDEISGMIDSYHYLYQERMAGIFDACHKNLWNYFQKQGDIPNLLRLFRHSSFIWRLHGKELKEKPFIDELQDVFFKKTPNSREMGSIEAEYFLARSDKIQGLLDARN